MYQNIVLHIPHNAKLIPTTIARKEGHPHPKELEEKSFYLIDYFTFILFSPGILNPRVSRIISPIHRMLIDMERLPNDPLEAKGFGIVSQWALDWYGISFRERAMSLYNDYQEWGMEVINSLDNPLLIDCHSFSEHPTPLCECPPDIDICIGWNEDETRPPQDVLDTVVAYFTNLGYSVGLNEPFSNSKTFPGAINYHSLMIEINKRCYMNEETVEKTEGFFKLQKELFDLYNILLND